ncbi:AraC family transcriptional regulator [Acinetobacter populi]|jgi:AraC-like DNA-binding protein|uniref:AraC family transcriptional regulator n=1 Tax=Acinetobacter populi TaxID=1582270 RepID=A0A1Z9YTZ6_9GAMM|nr:AraC family transcriptional regulator [Acinetobacter populi]MCH4248493.1 AraC family transcriptional regulator [Acinetobacter populi]OUY05677.1 AraC family transcriptional regulator [Acinetobacter populi]
MSRDTISIHFVNAALTGVKRMGLDVDNLLSHVGIEAELLRQPKARISPDQYTKFVQMLWLVTQDEHVGFDSQPRRLGTFAMMCQLIIHCKTLGEALERSTEFYRLFGDDWSVTLERDKHEARLIPLIPSDRDPDHFITESILMIWHGLASWLIERRLSLERVHFGYERPNHAEEYDALFFAPVMQFNASRTEITFAADYLDLPIRQTEETLEEFLKTAPAQLLVKFKNTNSLTNRIRDVLKSQIGEEMPTLNDVAAMLYLSPQTLRRRLAAEGKSYQGVKDSLRRDAAIHLLLRPELTLEDVAQQVGFSETSTFHRAFKKWTGVTPGLYRQLHGGFMHNDVL